jgi:hypothetical protein
MKNLFLAFGITLILISCSSSDDNSNPKNNLSINPPSWILGTWLLEEPNPTSGFRFANDDFCLVLPSQQSCFKESIQLTNNSGGATNVSETTTDTSYSIEITLISQIVTYKIEKVSSTQIELINDPLGELTETIYVKQ